MIDAAVVVARQTRASALMVYVDSLPDVGAVVSKLDHGLKLILVARDDAEAGRCSGHAAQVLRVPNLDLSRMGQIKMATLMAFSQRLLDAGEAFVSLVGVVGQPLDTLVTLTVGQESEVFQSVNQPKLTEHIKRVVFEKVLTIALELAHQGREGKAVGALFVVGDHREVTRCCQQNILNPFRGYNERHRNILSESMKETVKEFAPIDGAFIIKGNGVIVSAGTMLRPNIGAAEIPPGLGARHAAAAAISASTRCIAVTLSESTGTVRVWRRGQIFTEIERSLKSSRPPRNIEED
jgi:DNA integrity scanning protein DisA with diadenylate cyclase activity